MDVTSSLSLLMCLLGIKVAVRKYGLHRHDRLLSAYMRHTTSHAKKLTCLSRRFEKTLKRCIDISIARTTTGIVLSPVVSVQHPCGWSSERRKTQFKWTAPDGPPINSSAVPSSSSSSDTSARQYATELFLLFVATLHIINKSMYTLFVQPV